MKNTLYLLLIVFLFVACQKDDPVIKEDPFKGDSGEFTDTRDSRIYKWVRIGDQVWMAENLKYLPEVQSNADFDAKGIDLQPACGVYGYNGSNVGAAKTEDNYNTYGVLYNWYVTEQLNVCPVGWHVPTDDEWTELTSYIAAPHPLSLNKWLEKRFVVVII